MFDSVRSRLTLWYVGVLALVLVVFSMSVYALLARDFYERLDNDLRTSVEETGASMSRRIVGGEPEAQAAAEALEEHVGPREAAAVFDAGGRLVAENPALGDIHARLPRGAQNVAGEGALYTDDSGRRVGVRRVDVAPSGRAYLVVISRSFNLVTREMASIRLTLYLAVPLALVVAGLGGWFLARRSLAPVAEMTERARRISAENLEQRLPVVNPRDELGLLAETFNGLLRRLNSSFDLQRRFMADASHELRTPISVMRTATGVTLERDGREEGEYRDALKVVDEQAQRLTRIVEDMFTLARADTGRLAPRRERFRLDELLAETIRAAEVLGARKGLRVEAGRLEETPYVGDEGLLRQMILNLLDNAIKYTPPGGTVSACLERVPAGHAVSISDTGPGIPPEARAQIFERFYRVDKSRSRADSNGAGSGAGLGLSIARWIAEVHHGTLDLQRSDPTGSTFVATLPVTH
jgi:two-component system, OmpR family, sensor kinase